ncbi:hypothetical protein VNO77_20600 [Canavalia gladiata]|uniref:Uncharacterized protein n=1 Tax=Canavalia gladiata TaxID=3824 RepID=A0AAN9LTG5_CANGL
MIEASLPYMAAERRIRASVWRRKVPAITEDQVPSVTPIEVVGVVRKNEKPSIFVPANDPKSYRWFYVDVSGVALCHFVIGSKS